MSNHAIGQFRLRDGDQQLPVEGRGDVGAAVIHDLPLFAHKYKTQGLILDQLVASIQSDFESRIALGIERYGHPLQTFNGRDCLLDLYQELLDAAHYSKQDSLEHPSDTNTQRYNTILMLVFDTKASMLERKL